MLDVLVIFFVIAALARDVALIVGAVVLHKAVQAVLALFIIDVGFGLHRVRLTNVCLRMFV